MEAPTLKPPRLPRFRRASEPPAFRLTDDDVAIVRHLARHRFLRSTHIATLVSRSLDRTNDRLCRLYHAGYVDRPRNQRERYQTGSDHSDDHIAPHNSALQRTNLGVKFGVLPTYPSGNTHALTDLAVRAAKPRQAPYKLADGGGAFNKRRFTMEQHPDRVKRFEEWRAGPPAGRGRIAQAIRVRGNGAGSCSHVFRKSLDPEVTA